LAYDWNNLSYREKNYFNNDESLFLTKKQMFVENAKITNKMKSLHEKMKIISDSDEMQIIAKSLIDFDNIRFKNWQIIDIWQ